MPPLETPISGACTNLPTVAPGEEASTRKKSKHAQTYDGEDSDSEPEPDKEASDGAARAESPMIAHLHQFFSDILDAMQFMVERLPGVGRPIQTEDARCSTPQRVTRSYHVQRFRLHSERTCSTMVYQLALQVHSFLPSSQR